MMNHEHVLPQISDYVLDLLPVGERRQIEMHAAQCAPCREALQAERQLGGLVRATLARAAEPENGRLAHLMPAIPNQRQTRPGLWQNYQRQLALVGLLLVLLMGTFGLGYNNARRGWQPPVPTVVAVTATTTNEATATLAEVSTSTRFVETAVPTMPASPSPVNAAATPAPQPTPIAAARSPLAAN